MANISFREVNLGEVPILVLDGELFEIGGIEDVLLLMDDFLYLREGVGLVGLSVVADIVIGLDIASGDGIVFRHVVEVGVFILIAFPAWFFLLFEPGEFLVVVDEIQIVLIVGLFFLPALLFFFLLLLFLLLVLFGLLALLFVVGVVAAVGCFIAFGLVLVIDDEVALVVVVVIALGVLFFGVGGGLLYFAAFPVFVLVGGVHLDLIIIF